MEARIQPVLEPLAVRKPVNPAFNGTNSRALHHCLEGAACFEQLGSAKAARSACTQSARDFTGSELLGKVLFCLFISRPHAVTRPGTGNKTRQFIAQVECRAFGKASARGKCGSHSVLISGLSLTQLRKRFSLARTDLARLLKLLKAGLHFLPITGLAETDFRLFLALKC
jgi:hypothetical protein